MPAQTESLSPRTGEEPAPTSNPAESLFTTLTPTFLPLNHLGSNCYAFLPESTEIPLFHKCCARLSVRSASRGPSSCIVLAARSECIHLRDVCQCRALALKALPAEAAAWRSAWTC